MHDVAYNCQSSGFLSRQHCTLACLCCRCCRPYLPVVPFSPAPAQHRDSAWQFHRGGKTLQEQQSSHGCGSGRIQGAGTQSHGLPGPLAPIRPLAGPLIVPPDRHTALALPRAGPPITPPRPPTTPPAAPPGCACPSSMPTCCTRSHCCAMCPPSNGNCASGLPHVIYCTHTPWS